MFSTLAFRFFLFRLFVLDSCEPGLQGAPHCLHSRWSASLNGSLRTVHAHMCPIRVSRTLDRITLRKSCLSAGEQLSFIRRLARRFWATTGFGCMCLKTLRRFSKKIGHGRGRALRFDMVDIIHTLNDLISSCRDSEEGFGKAAKGAHSDQLR